MACPAACVMSFSGSPMSQTQPKVEKAREDEERKRSDEQLLERVGSAMDEPVQDRGDDTAATKPMRADATVGMITLLMTAFPLNVAGCSAWRRWRADEAADERVRGASTDAVVPGDQVPDDGPDERRQHRCFDWRRPDPDLGHRVGHFGSGR